MSLVLTFSCDGHRFKSRCRGAFPTRGIDFSEAYHESAKQGWRRRYMDGKGLWLCPSPNHDEENLA